MHRATYSPEDNKLRLYPDWDDPAFDKEDVKAAGFRWASKQECYVAPKWTVKAEDALLELVDDIEDEDYSPLERSADRAERFGGYRDKRSGEAHDHADTFEAGPSAFGHQNQKRAERQAKRHDRHRTKAVSQWGKAEYWQTRTEGVIANALHKAKPSVRRGRILRLEKELRSHERSIEVLRSKRDGARRALELPGGDKPETERTGGDPRLIANSQRGCSPIFDCSKSDDPAVIMFTLANYGYDGYDYKHPRRELDPDAYNGGRDSLYSLMTDKEDPISPNEAAELMLASMPDLEDDNHWSNRWSRHYDLRLTYENAMLENEGGKAAEVEMEPGGFIGKYQIHGVNKSPTTGRVTSVKLMTCQEPWGRTRTNDKGEPVYFLRSFNVERLGSDVYRPPTDEERQAFAESKAKAKAKTKAANKSKPKLINPTNEDAERLQKLWNDAANVRIAEYNKRTGYDSAKPSEVDVAYITQAKYSANSKGDYSRCETVSVCEDGQQPKRRTENPPIAFKVRKTYGGGGFTHGADRVIVLTDKPQKPLPLDWDAVEAPYKEQEPASPGMLF